MLVMHLIRDKKFDNKGWYEYIIVGNCTLWMILCNKLINIFMFIVLLECDTNRINRYNTILRYEPIYNTINATIQKLANRS